MSSDYGKTEVSFLHKVNTSSRTVELTVNGNFNASQQTFCGCLFLFPLIVYNKNVSLLNKK